MLITNLSSALSKVYTDDYFPIPNHVKLALADNKIPIEKPTFSNIRLLSPTGLTIPQLNDFLTAYNSKTLICGTDFGIALAQDSTICLYDTTMFKLQMLIPLTDRIICMRYIEDYLILLTAEKYAYSIDLCSGLVLAKLSLQYDFQDLSEVIYLQEETRASQNDTTVIALHGPHSYIQFIQLTHDTGELNLLTPLEYVPFIPVCFLKLSATSLFYYVFSGVGTHVVCIVSDIVEVSELSGSELCNKEYGRLLQLRRVQQGLIVIQEKGWTMFELGSGSSLKALQELVSCPLSSTTEMTVFRSGDDESTLMVKAIGGEVTIVRGNHITVVESSEDVLLDIVQIGDDTYGIFTGKVCLLKDSMWCRVNSGEVKCEVSNVADTSQREVFQDSLVSIRSTMGKLVVHYHSSGEWSLLGTYRPDTLIIPLNSVTENGRDHADAKLAYYLITDSTLKFRLLVLERDPGLTGPGIVQLLEIEDFIREATSFTSVYYFEEERVLQFVGSVKLYVSLDNFNYVRKVKSDEKLLIFQDEYFQATSAEGRLMFESIETLESLVTFPYGQWIGLERDGQASFYSWSPQTLETCSTLLALKMMMNNEAHTSSIENRKYSYRQIKQMIGGILRLCAVDNNSIIDASVDLLSTLLKSYPDIVPRIFDDYKNTASLMGTVVVFLCLSVDGSLISKSGNGKIWPRLVSYLHLMDTRICEICVDVMMCLNFDVIQAVELEENRSHTNIELLSSLLRLRAQLLEKPNGRDCSEKITEVLNGIMQSENDMLKCSVILFTIIESPGFSLSDKNCTINYIICLSLQRPTVWRSGPHYQLVLYLMVNSVFKFLSQVEQFDEPELGLDSTFDSVNLMFNIIGECYDDVFCIEFEGDWRKVVKGEDNMRACLLTDIMGYNGVVFSKLRGEGWNMVPLKCSRSEIVKLDNEISNDKVDTEHIREKLKDNEMNKEATKSVGHIRSPLLFDNGKCLAVLDIKRLAIVVWRPGDKEGHFHDNLCVDVLRNDSIMLKIPDFNLIVLQLLWRELSGPMERLSEVIHEFQHEISVSPLSSPVKKRSVLRSPTFEVEYSELSLVCEPYGEYQFGFILEGYLPVFEGICTSDIAIAVSTAHSGQLQLTIGDKPVFVFSTCSL